jgi:hypothetical protein
VISSSAPHVCEHNVYAFTRSLCKHFLSDAIVESDPDLGISREHGRHKIRRQVIVKELEAGQCDQLVRDRELANAWRTVQEHEVHSLTLSFPR